MLARLVVISKRKLIRKTRKASKIKIYAYTLTFDPDMGLEATVTFH